MRSACTLLALAGLSQAKVFLFNAENCNTNFDNFKNYDFVSEQLLFRFFFSPLFPFFFRSRTARWLCNQTPNPRAVPPASKQIFHSKSECMCVSAVCVPVGERRAPFFFPSTFTNYFFSASIVRPFACSLAVRSTRPSIWKTCGPATKPPKMLRSRLRTTPKSQSLSVSPLVSRFLFRFLGISRKHRTLHSTLCASVHYFLFRFLGISRKHRTLHSTLCASVHDRLTFVNYGSSTTLCPPRPTKLHQNWRRM